MTRAEWLLMLLHAVAMGQLHGIALQCPWPFDMLSSHLHMDVKLCRSLPAGQLRCLSLGHPLIDRATGPDQSWMTGLLLGFIPGFYTLFPSQMTGNLPGFVPETLMSHLRARMSHSQPISSFS